MNRRHVIVGAGPAAISAAETIRRLAPDDALTLVSDEPAHSRMALPYWISGKIGRAQTHLGDDAYFGRLRVETRWGVRATRVDPAQRVVTLSDGSCVAFDRLLLATGSRPLRLPVPGADLPLVQPMWTLDHAQQALEQLASHKRPRVGLIGAGFIGMIVLNAMFQRGWQLTVLEREPQVLPRMLTPAASEHVARWLEARQVTVCCPAQVTAIRPSGERATIELDGRGPIEDLDLVIIATGVQPNVQLAEDAGLDTEYGILVNEHLESSEPGIFAAGDVAQGPVLLSDQRQVHAIQPTAVDHGRVAGANMAGQPTRYPGSLSMNVLDVCGLQCASFGACDRSRPDRTVVRNADDFIHRELIWEADRLVGAVFVGRATDAGMLTDIGMAKGLVQTQMPLGPWKDYLVHQPFDLRRAFVASGAPARLARFRLLDQPAQPRGFRYGDAPLPSARSSHHAVFFPT